MTFRLSNERGRGGRIIMPDKFSYHTGLLKCPDVHK